MKKIIYGSEARMKLNSGVEKLSRAVKSTLGPGGRNVLIKSKQDQEPFSTKDGVTVAGQFSSEDPIEQIAIETIQKVSSDTDSLAGDGTTTASVLAEHILEKGLNFPSNLNLLDIKKGIDECSDKVVKILKERAIPCNSLEDLNKVAMISSNYDNEVADIVTDAFQISGKQGIVNIKRSRDTKSRVTSIKGMNMPTGYHSKEYINDYENEICEFQNAYVYMTNSKISEVSENLSHVLEQVSKSGRELLIICKDIDTLVSNMLITNKRKGSIKVCVCKAPGFGEDQEKLLRDIGCALGMEPFIEGDSIDFNEIDQDSIFDYLPVSEEIFVSEQNLSIKSLDSQKDAMAARADLLREESGDHKNTYEKSVLNARISRLTDGIAIIHIGALTDIAFVEKQHRIQDALYAVKAANEDGVIPGGGAALFTIGNEYFDLPLNKSKAYGYNIVLRAIQMPLIQICENAGIEVPYPHEYSFIENIIAKIQEWINPAENKMSKYDYDKIKDEFEIGYDVKTNTLCNMITKKIIDPVKVTTVALQNAASISGLLLTTECVIVETTSFDKKNLYNE
jgi:chaperonin GroEL